MASNTIGSEQISVRPQCRVDFELVGLVPRFKLDDTILQHGTLVKQQTFQVFGLAFRLQLPPQFIIDSLPGRVAVTLGRMGLREEIGAPGSPTSHIDQVDFGRNLRRTENPQVVDRGIVRWLVRLDDQPRIGRSVKRFFVNLHSVGPCRHLVPVDLETGLGLHVPRR